MRKFLIPRAEHVFEMYEGQAVLLQPFGNIARFLDGAPRRGEIVSIKRKYFYVQIANTKTLLKFERETFININDDENSHYVLWETKEEYESFIQFWDNIAEIGSAIEAIRNMPFEQQRIFFNDIQNFRDALSRNDTRIDNEP